MNQLSADDDSVAYCEAHCDSYGYYQPGKWCVAQDESVDVYCCGDANTRYCCGDPSQDVGDKYPPVKSCPNSTWLMQQYGYSYVIGFVVLVT